MSRGGPFEGRAVLTGRRFIRDRLGDDAQEPDGEVRDDDEAEDEEYEEPEAEALALVRAYYDDLRSGDYAAGWAQLTPEFVAARNLTFERYVNYWRATSLTLDQLRFTSGPGPGEARVRFDFKKFEKQKYPEK